MVRVLTKAILCSHCDKPTQRPTATLEQIFGYLRGSTRNDDQIAFACPHCKHLGLAFVAQESQWFEIADLESHPDGMTDYAVFLLCDQPDCQFPVLLLAPMTPGKDDHQVRLELRKRTDDGLKCPQEYQLRKPLELAVPSREYI